MLERNQTSNTSCIKCIRNYIVGLHRYKYLSQAFSCTNIGVNFVPKLDKMTENVIQFIVGNNLGCNTVGYDNIDDLHCLRSPLICTARVAIEEACVILTATSNTISPARARFVWGEPLCSTFCLDIPWVWVSLMMQSLNGILFPRYCFFVRGNHRSPVDSCHEGQWLEALMLSLICAWKGLVNTPVIWDAHALIMTFRNVSF